MDINKQQPFDADSKTIQQVNFIGDLDGTVTHFYC